MTLGRKNKHFEEVTNADIAEEIIGRYGLEKELESSAYQYREAVQLNTTDWDFILSRKDRTGRICLVEDGKIIIRQLALSASRSEEHTSELQSLMRISYAVFC